MARVAVPVLAAHKSPGKKTKKSSLQPPRLSNSNTAAHLAVALPSSAGRSKKFDSVTTIA
eukprot:3077859-Pleurochrysis_carterae.AAC.1